MLIKDEETIHRHVSGDAKRQAIISAKTRLAAEVEKGRVEATNNWANPERQKGRYLTHEQLEALISRLCPYRSNLLFVNHPWNPNLRGVFVVEPNGNKERIAWYNRGVIPEMDVMEEAYDYVPDPDLPSLSDGTPVITPEVMRKTPEKPGFIKVRTQGEVVVKGWRAVILQLVDFYLIRAEDASRALQSESQAWNHYLTGNGSNPLTAKA